MLTSKWHEKQEHFFIHAFRSFQCIRFVKKHFFLLQTTGKGGGILDYVPFWAPGHFDWTKLAHCTSRSCVLQNKTTIRPLRHIHVLRIFLTKSPCVAPGGPDWTKLAHCTSRSCILQNRTTIRPLRHILRIFFDKVYRTRMHNKNFVCMERNSATPNPLCHIAFDIPERYNLYSTSEPDKLVASK